MANVHGFRDLNNNSNQPPRQQRAQQGYGWNNAPQQNQNPNPNPNPDMEDPNINIPFMCKFLSS